jgi:hypothetical protein
MFFKVSHTPCLRLQALSKGGHPVTSVAATISAASTAAVATSAVATASARVSVAAAIAAAATGNMLASII